MSAIRGIIVSISIITALSVAVLENPQIQVWLEEQRRKIQELLRSIGEELDPQSRRAAEAFAFEGQTVVNDAGIRREAATSQQAAAIATGRSLEGGSTIYRIPVKGPLDPKDAEERRRKGREYLAKRNSEMETRRSMVATKCKPEEAPQSPTFDAFVDGEGKLKSAGPRYHSPPTQNPATAEIAEEMKKVERNLALPISAAGESSLGDGFRYANPFGDESALERNITPRQPPVPPKIASEPTESFPNDPEISVRGSWAATETARPAQSDAEYGELSYEEQLAIAMSLSEQESSSANSMKRQPEQEDVEMAAAIAASLRDMNMQEDIAPGSTLVDLTPSAPVVTPRRSDWDKLLGSPSSQQVPSPSVASSEDIYGATPELKRARLAKFNALQGESSHLPFDPVRDAARTSASPSAGIPSASAAEVTPTPTLDHKVTYSGARTPTSHTQSSFGFRSDDADDFESLTFASTGSRARSWSRSEISGVEVVDLEDDSDVDMLSEEGDGIVTPDSWSEVASREADSEMEDDAARMPVPVGM